MRATPPRMTASLVVLLSSSAPPLHRALGLGVSFMSPTERPSPGPVPFGTCPRCRSHGPPVVTVVTSLLLYFTCTYCGFEWSVVPSYVARVGRIGET
jgi:hypothetical protein